MHGKRCAFIIACANFCLVDHCAWGMGLEAMEAGSYKSGRREPNISQREAVGILLDVGAQKSDRTRSISNCGERGKLDSLKYVLCAVCLSNKLCASYVCEIVLVA